MKDSTVIFLGVVSAVIAAFAIEWLNRVLNSNATTPSQAAWNCTLHGGACGPTACILPNYNLRPQSPASAYQSGAPVTNYRSVTRVGVLEVPVSE